MYCKAPSTIKDLAYVAVSLNTIEVDDAFRLATNVMEMNKSFSEMIRLKGFTRTFRSSDSKEPELATLSSSDNTPSTTLSPAGSGNRELPQYPELRAIPSKSETEPPHAKSDIMRWITEKYDRSKGFEIGTLNPSLLPSLFVEQSRAWQYHASFHVRNVIRAIHEYNHKALVYCCKDIELSERLWGRLS